MPLKKLKSIGKKILGGAGKAVKKIVPKEVAGIMQVAAPFVAASNPMAALALTTAGQYKSRGRINPLQTILSLAPSPQVRGFTRGLPGGQAFDQFLYGAKATGPYASMAGGELRMLPGTDATQGILGIGGEFGAKEFLKGSLLSPDKKLSKSRLAALAASGLSLATATKQIEEEAAEIGASDSELDALRAEAAEFWSTLSSDDFKVTPTLAKGGRVGFALGTRPTAQESGLGGLPIEADMRYSGGFMPYGAKEKADDVPARLSKNEFVFTADAVRAAGGGSVQKGAQKMYNTMKQLEAMGRA
jgi:hypothetical protein